MKISENIADVVSKVKGISFEEACELPMVREIEEIGHQYTQMEIEKEFGENYIMGNAFGGIGLDMVVQQLIDVGENDEKEEYGDFFPDGISKGEIK